MITNPSIWKSFIHNHHARAWLEGNIFAAGSTAFAATKHETHLLGTALGINPNIFLILLRYTMQPTLLVHHISKVLKNTLLIDDMDEFFCILLLGWKQTVMGIKIHPSSFFAATHDKEGNMVGNKANESIVRKASMQMLRAAANKEDCSQCLLVVPDEVTTPWPLPKSFCVLPHQTLTRWGLFFWYRE